MLPSFFEVLYHHIYKYLLVFPAPVVFGEEDAILRKALQICQRAALGFDWGFYWQRAHQNPAL